MFSGMRKHSNMCRTAVRCAQASCAAVLVRSPSFEAGSLPTGAADDVHDGISSTFRSASGLTRVGRRVGLRSHYSYGSDVLSVGMQSSTTSLSSSPRLHSALTSQEQESRSLRSSSSQEDLSELQFRFDVRMLSVGPLNLLIEDNTVQPAAVMKHVIPPVDSGSITGAWDDKLKVFRLSYMNPRGCKITENTFPWEFSGKPNGVRLESDCLEQYDGGVTFGESKEYIRSFVNRASFWKTPKFEVALKLERPGDLGLILSHPDHPSLTLCHTIRGYSSNSFSCYWEEETGRFQIRHQNDDGDYITEYTDKWAHEGVLPKSVVARSTERIFSSAPTTMARRVPGSRDVKASPNDRSSVARVDERPETVDAQNGKPATGESLSLPRGLEILSAELPNGSGSTRMEPSVLCRAQLSR